METIEIFSRINSLKGWLLAAATQADRAPGDALHFSQAHEPPERDESRIIRLETSLNLLAKSLQLAAAQAGEDAIIARDLEFDLLKERAHRNQLEESLERSRADLRQAVWQGAVRASTHEPK